MNTRQRQQNICLVWLAFVLPLAAVGHARAADQSLRFVPSATALNLGDPIFAKVVLRNEGKLPLTISHLLMDGSAGFDGRPESSKDFTKITSARDDPHTITADPFPVRLAVQEEYAVYDLIFLDPKRQALALSSAGRYDVRARLRVNGAKIMSPPVTLSIATTSPKNETTIRRHFGTVYLLTALGWPDYSPRFKNVREFARQFHEDSRSLPEHLDEGILRRTVLWRLAAEELCATKDKASALVAWAKVQRLRQTADPVSRELIDLMAAGHFVHLREWDAANERINQVKTRSDTRDWIKLQIDIAQGRAKDPSMPGPRK